jgi:hypothetical protein
VKPSAAEIHALLAVQGCEAYVNDLDGHELLVCERSHTGQGVTDSVIYSLDFHRTR